VLLLPQLAVTFVFFFWPAGQAIVQSVQGGDAFGLSTRFVALENFAVVLAEPAYLASVEVTLIFSFAVALLALAPGLLFAVMADRIVRGAAFYKTVLLLPYAVAPAIAGVLWLFLFNPSVGIIAVALRRAGVDWNYVLNGRQILVYKVWYDGVVGLDLGSSAAQSVILMTIVIALTAIQFRFIERRVHYA